MLTTLINIIAAPRQAYEQLRGKPTIGFPVLFVLLVISATTFMFFHLADPDLLIDDLLNQAGDDLSDAEQAEAKANMQNMPEGMLKWISTAGGSFGVLFMLLVHALYFYITSMFNGTKIGYKPWLSFVAWSNIPALFASIAGLATLLMSSGHISLMELNPFTLTNLFGLNSDNKALTNTLNNLDLTRLWSLGLMVFGYQLWTQKSWLHSGLIVLLPIAIIFGTTYALAV